MENIFYAGLDALLVHASLLINICYEELPLTAKSSLLLMVFQNPVHDHTQTANAYKMKKSRPKWRSGGKQGAKRKFYLFIYSFCHDYQVQSEFPGN